MKLKLLKALLSKEQFDRLSRELPQKMRHINMESIHITKYTPGDIRLRYSNKTFELVSKEGDVTHIARKEVIIPLGSRKAVEYMTNLFSRFLKADPPWLKHKNEYEYDFNGFTYIVCLQYIEKFAYILEVEYLDKKDTSTVHEPNIRAIIQQLGCTPINPAEFSAKISEYIKEN